MLEVLRYVPCGQVNIIVCPNNPKPTGQGISQLYRQDTSNGYEDKNINVVRPSSFCDATSKIIAGYIFVADGQSPICLIGGWPWHCTPMVQANPIIEIRWTYAWIGDPEDRGNWYGPYYGIWIASYEPLKFPLQIGRPRAFKYILNDKNQFSS